MIDNEEIGKYKKRKESNVSKSERKSKHKHKYKDCLLIDHNKPHKAKYCKICGKINDVKFFETKRLDNNRYLMLEDEEIFDKYKELEKFYIDSIWDKYVEINAIKEK